MLLRLKANRRKADQAWAEIRPAPIGDFGSVERLSILPLIDWYTERDGLIGEAGVSFLVSADDRKILFDVGANWKGVEPSPLKRNMDALGISVDEIDDIVISHPHADHIGGIKPSREKRFMLSPHDWDLTGKRAYVPAPLTHPTATVVLAEQPQVLGPGVATTGIILRAFFLLGMCPEQALAVNVKDKGIVLIVGCGHQGIRRLLERARRLFKEPLYGIIAGLHFPVTQSRIGGRILNQRRIGTGKYLWQTITPQEVKEAVSILEAAGPRLVAISAHDSCDWSIGQFREAFGNSYRDVLVGREIIV